MNTPGFTAAATLYAPNEPYHIAGATDRGGTELIRPAYWHQRCYRLCRRTCGDDSGCLARCTSACAVVF